MSLYTTQTEYHVGVTGDADEHDFLAAYDPRGFHPIAVTVDLVVLTVRQGQLCVLLIRRGAHPFRGAWALPGGFVGAREDLETAARRELVEETGLDAQTHIEQLASYGSPDRDPRMRVISVAYLALAAAFPNPAPGTDAAEARFWPIADLTNRTADVDGPALAFDHDGILGDAVDRARAKLEYTSLATTFLDEPFTIADLRRVYEAVWGIELHPANFRRKVLSTPGLVVPTGEERATGRGWAELYTRGTTKQLHPPLLRPHR
jgi:8-oxo-dGTP diphosphatase